MLCLESENYFLGYKHLDNLISNYTSINIKTIKTREGKSTSIAMKAAVYAL
jgi:hypothetical protein